jgi:type II secretory pathway pseudopilin PulG
VRRPIRNSRGFSLIEMTVMLSVMFILAGALSPIVSESITTARAVKAKNDASLIAIGFINLQKDVGADALTMGGAAVASPGVRLPDVLASAGNTPSTEDRGEASQAAALPVLDLFTRGAGGNDNGRGSPASRLRRKWIEAVSGALDDHLMSNRSGYRYRKPGEYGGWNGPYISAEIKGDPWGGQYLINSEWLDGGITAADSQGRPRRAVFVISAGNNGVIETPFEQSIVDARPYGDDIVIRIQ